MENEMLKTSESLYITIETKEGLLYRTDINKEGIWKLMSDGIWKEVSLIPKEVSDWFEKYMIFRESGFGPEGHNHIAWEIGYKKDGKSYPTGVLIRGRSSKKMEDMAKKIQEEIPGIELCTFFREVKDDISKDDIQKIKDLK